MRRQIAHSDYPNVLKILINEQGNVELNKLLLFENLTIDEDLEMRIEDS